MPPCSRSLRKRCQFGRRESVFIVMVCRSFVQSVSQTWPSSPPTPTSYLICLLDSSAAIQVACNLTAAVAFLFYIRKAGRFRFINPCEYRKLRASSEQLSFPEAPVGNPTVPKTDTECHLRECTRVDPPDRSLRLSSEDVKGRVAVRTSGGSQTGSPAGQSRAADSTIGRSESARPRWWPRPPA